MNFSYTIDYQNKQERTITVLYQHDDPKALAVVYVLSYPEGATAEEIHAIALEHAPLAKWQEAISREDPDFELGSFSGTAEEAETASRRHLVPPTLADLKAAKSLEIEQWRVRAEQKGMGYAFPGGAPDRIQLRDSRDIANINGQVSAALILQGQGVIDPLLPFRAESNVTHAMTPAQMIDMGMAVNTYIGDGYKTAWSLKEQAAAATTAQDLDAIVWPN